MNKILLINGLSVFLTTNLLAATSYIQKDSTLSIADGGVYEVLAENKAENNGVITAAGQPTINVDGLISNKGSILLNDITNGEHIKLKLDSNGVIEINNSVPNNGTPTIESIKTISNGTKQTINTNLQRGTIVLGNCEIGANTSVITDRNGEDAILLLKKSDISGHLETDRNMIFE